MNDAPHTEHITISLSRDIAKEEARPASANVGGVIREKKRCPDMKSRRYRRSTDDGRGTEKKEAFKRLPKRDVGSFQTAMSSRPVLTDWNEGKERSEKKPLLLHKKILLLERKRTSISDSPSFFLSVASQ